MELLKLGSYFERQISGVDDDFASKPGLLQSGDQLQTINLGHFVVGDQQVESHHRCYVLCLPAIFHRDNRVPCFGKESAHHFRIQALIFSGQYMEMVCWCCAHGADRWTRRTATRRRANGAGA